MTFPDDAFLALVPLQAVTAEPGESDTVILIRPKVLSPRWAWILRHLRRPNYRVKLDARGTALWRVCDGNRTVAEVIDSMVRAHPDEPDARTHAALFLRELHRGGFLCWA